jgi:hypothetical protein
MLPRGSLGEFLVVEFLMGDVLVPSGHPLLAQPAEQILRHHRGGMW